MIQDIPIAASWQLSCNPSNPELAPGNGYFSGICLPLLLATAVAGAAIATPPCCTSETEAAEAAAPPEQSSLAPDGVTALGLLGLPLLLATAAAGAAADGVGGGRPPELCATTGLPDDAEQKENSGTLMYCAKGFMLDHKIPKRGITGDKRGILGRGNLTRTRCDAQVDWSKI